MPKQPTTVQGLGQAECPCGQKFVVSLDPPAVIHELPMCTRFLELEPAAFVAWVNDSRRTD